MTEGRESPPPEQQSGAQLKEPTGTGSKGNKPTTQKESGESTGGVQNLESNPKGPMDDNLKAKFHKGPGNDP